MMRQVDLRLPALQVPPSYLAPNNGAASAPSFGLVHQRPHPPPPPLPLYSTSQHQQHHYPPPPPLLFQCSPFHSTDTPQGSLVSGSESLQWMWTAAPSSSAVGGATTTTTAVSSQRGSGGGGLPFAGGAGGAMSVVPIPTVFAPAGSTTSPLLPSSGPLSRDRDESASFPRTDEEGSATRTYRSVSLENGLATASCSKVDELYPISVLERMKPTDASTTVVEEHDVPGDGAVTAMALFLSNHSQEDVQDRNQQQQQQQPQQLNGDEKEQVEAGPGKWAGMRPVAVEISPRGGTTLVHPPHECLDDVLLQNKFVSKSDDEIRLLRCQQPTGLPPSDPHHSISNDLLHHQHHHHPHHLHYLLPHYQQQHPTIVAPDGNNASMSRLMPAVPFCGPPPPPPAITDHAHLAVRDSDAPPLQSATHHHHPYPYPYRHVGYEEIVLTAPPVAARSPTTGSSLGGGRSDLLEEGEGTHTKMSKNDSLPFVPSPPDREGEEKGDMQQEEEEEEPDIATDHRTVPPGGPLHCQTSLFPKPLDAAVVADGSSDLHLLQQRQHHHKEEAVTPTAPSSGRRSAPRRASSFSLDLLGSSSSSGSHYADTAEGPKAPACTLALPVYCEHLPPPDGDADMDRPHPANTPPPCFSSSAEGVAVVKPHPMLTIAEDTPTASLSSPFPTGKTAMGRKETHVVGDHHVNDESSGSVLSKGITSRCGFSSHTTAAAGGIPPLVPSSSVSPESRSGASLRRSTFGFSAMSHPPRSDSSSVKRVVGCCSSHSNSRLSVVDVVDLRFSIAASGVLPLSSTLLSSPSSFHQTHRRTSTTPSSPQPPHPTPCIPNGNEDDLSMNHNNKNHKNLSLPPASAAGGGGGCEGSLPRPLQNRETLGDDDEEGVELPESPGHRHAFDTTFKQQQQQQQQQPHQNQQQLLMAGSWSLCSERLLAAAAGAVVSLPQQERGTTMMMMMTGRRNLSAAVPSNELSHGSLKTTNNEKDDCKADVRPIWPSCFSSSFSSSSPSSAQVLAGGTKRIVRLPTDCKVSSLDNAEGGMLSRRQHDVEEMSALLKLMCTPPPPPVTRQ